MATIRDNAGEVLVVPTVLGSRGARYSITTDRDGVISCTCQAWKWEKCAISQRMCKHIRTELSRQSVLRRTRTISTVQVGVGAGSPAPRQPEPPPVMASATATVRPAATQPARQPVAKPSLKPDGSVPAVGEIMAALPETLYGEARTATAAREHARLTREAATLVASQSRDPQAASRVRDDWEVSHVVERFKRLELD
jgi:hypothetical protein